MARDVTVNEPAVQVQSLSKLYRLGIAERRHDTLAGTIASWLRAPARNYARLKSLSRFEDESASDVLWALRNVTFDVAKGEVLGIIGRNGAGKSTLLKILSRVTDPTHGWAVMDGRAASLLEVGTGFHPELTGRENVYLNGSILGMSKGEIDRKFDAIADFSGVERFLDTPVKRYSSGMQVRLAFSVAAHLEPEILIIDEVLAVGDAEFQAKCIGKMKSVATSGGRTVLFVSHNMSAIKQLCDRAILLNGGQVDFVGDPDSVVRQYLSSGAVSRREIQWDGSEAPHSDELTFRSVRIVDSEGSADSTLATGESIDIEVRYGISRALANLRIALTLLTDDGVEVLATSDFHAQGDRRTREPGEYVSVCHIPGGLLNTGRYVVSVDADIPRTAILVRDVQVGFDIDDLTDNHLGITLSNRPSGVVHPCLPWRVTRTDEGNERSANSN